jgi:hypothetical protein
MRYVPIVRSNIHRPKISIVPIKTALQGSHTHPCSYIDERSALHSISQRDVGAENSLIVLRSVVG